MGIAEVIARRYAVVGGAGFIGGHAVDRLLRRTDVTKVTIYDNFSSGREWHHAHHAEDDRLSVIRGDVKDLDSLTGALRGHDTVMHLASNPDIARAATEPDIDFWEGTFLTNQVVEAMRRAEVPTLLYASGSGVYGDIGAIEAQEDHSPLEPVSTYGASKLSGEVLIAAYCHIFGLRGRAFRFGNVVGPRQTHGVGFDFVRRLLADATQLDILGNGSQSKSYIHVDDVLNAVFKAETVGDAPFAVFNVATGDYITVTEIAHLAIDALGLQRENVRLNYSGGDRGWKGDVPVVRINTDRIRSLGWSNERMSAGALDAAMKSMLVDFRADRM
jgi:UDP-glucose 4-epimerase